MAQIRRDAGDVLVQGKIITQDQLDQAREVAASRNLLLEDVLETEFSVDPLRVLQARAHLHNMKAIDLHQRPPEPSAISLVPAAVAQRHKVMPITRTVSAGSDVLVVAMTDPSNVMAIDAVQAAARIKIMPVLARTTQVEDAIKKFYGESATNGALTNPNSTDTGPSIGMSGISDLVKDYGGSTEIADDDAGDLDETVQGPIIRIAHSLIQEAVKLGASDIHVEPGARHVRVRYRIDGVLHEVMQMPRHIHPPLISRYKIMSEMNIAERRVPQDGRIGINYQGKDYDLRVSCLPTLNGEKIVMRILDKGSVMIGLNRLGFFPDTLSQLERLITQPNGMFLTTGPTGAGKTTTLYSALHRINSVERNIMTVEDPVEYQLPGVSQVAVHRKAGLTFATALRSFMRQDPDIIMVGEIRDLETAEMAIQASLTGHLVLSTLHTNDAPSSVTRLVDMGVEPFLVSATLVGALAQRLGRRICEACKEQYEGDTEVLMALGFKSDSASVTLHRGRGCDNCRNTGYKGRIGIYELMLVNEEISDLIVRRAPVTEVRHAAMAIGMKTLKEDGLRKVQAGITTSEEIQRVVFTAGH